MCYDSNKYMKKGGDNLKKLDIIVISVIFTFAAALAIFFFVFSKNGKTVVVKQDKKVVAEYPLNVDREVKLKGNTFIIKDKNVFMSHADCKNQICVKTGKISKRGECIVCLPNKVILEIQ